MSLILNIDTSGNESFAALSLNGIVLSKKENSIQSDHAVFIHTAIKNIFDEAGRTLSETDAIAVCPGPGSYTGIRVGMASAKGLCFALDRPLILVNALEMIANEMISVNEGKKGFYCPMIDARRMEVFAAVYDENLIEVKPPCPLILDQDTFNKYDKILFSGNGIMKYKNLYRGGGKFFNTSNFASSMSKLSHKKFVVADFCDLISSDPMYLKEFFDNK